MFRDPAVVSWPTTLWVYCQGREMNELERGGLHKCTDLDMKHEDEQRRRENRRRNAHGRPSGKHPRYLPH